ncbi:MAG: hypothetical protein LUD51_00315 [Clostridia bacterium]|nr:hypothetical protein [Clostridia bacterium]
MRGSKLDKTMLEGKVFDYIQTFTAKNGFAPAIRDICKGCDIKSTATVYYVINSLCDKGLLRKPGKNMRRAVGLVANSVVAPSLGSIDNGNGIYSLDNYEDFFAVPSNFFFGEDLFVFTAVDDAMVNIGILKGDRVVVLKTDSEACDDGDLVEVLINGYATVRRAFFPDENCILKCENDTGEDIECDASVIIGKVVGMMRNYV